MGADSCGCEWWSEPKNVAVPWGRPCPPPWRESEARMRPGSSSSSGRWRPHTVSCGKTDTIASWSDKPHNGTVGGLCSRVCSNCQPLRSLATNESAAPLLARCTFDSLRGSAAVKWRTLHGGRWTPCVWKRERRSDWVGYARARGRGQIGICGI